MHFLHFRPPCEDLSTVRRNTIAKAILSAFVTTFAAFTTFAAITAITALYDAIAEHSRMALLLTT